MKKLLLLTALLVPGLAQAADLRLKAPALAVPSCTLTSCSGFYVGGNIVDAGGNFNVVSTGLSGLSSNGMMFGAQAGYQYWNGAWFGAIEADVDYGITNNVTLPGGGNSSQYALGGLVKLGYGISGLLGATPGTPPTLPVSLTADLISPYVALGVWDRKWGAGFVTGAGVQALIANNVTLSAEYLHVNYNNAAVNPIVSEQTEDMVRIAIDRHF